MSELLYAEDLVIGSAWDLGSYVVTEPEIIEFARQWDPQGFHVDPDVAAAGYFGGIIASGIHTMAIFRGSRCPRCSTAGRPSRRRAGG